MISLYATVASFKRTQRAETEIGVMVTGENGVNVIVDREGRAVAAPIWTYTELPRYGCFTVDEP